MENNPNEYVPINYDEIINGFFDLIIVNSQGYLKSEKRDCKRFSESLISTLELLEKSIEKNFDNRVKGYQSDEF